MENNKEQERIRHIKFIENDTKERGEEITSDIIFFGALYSCKVKKVGSKRSKSIMYSAAQSIMQGYRAIKTTPPISNNKQ